MKIVNKKVRASVDWFNNMESDINNMQREFISNLKSKIREEKSVYPYEVRDQSSLDRTQELEVILNNVDDNTSEFINKLVKGMEEIINSHNIKQ
ncbi:MAG: hypothetical protein JAY88_02550 [Candidatus Thiodiazotropha lotti]|nr:hypothetical protein [Candidatus Thiodiazotropha lotti]MCW4185946.1 hypothetical protein [Candidatus Thiodiazotropha lotti]